MENEIKQFYNVVDDDAYKYEEADIYNTKNNERNVGIDIQISNVVDKVAVKCNNCEIEETKNQCENCGNFICSKCEIKVHRVSVLEFMKNNDFLNYTCNTVHN